MNEIIDNIGHEKNHHLASFIIFYQEFLGYGEKKQPDDELNAVKKLMYKWKIISEEDDDGEVLELYEKIREGIKTYEDGFLKIGHTISNLNLDDNQILTFVKACIEMYLFTNSSDGKFTGDELVSDDEIKYRFYEGYDEETKKAFKNLKFLEIINDSIGDDKVVKILLDMIMNQLNQQKAEENRRKNQKEIISKAEDLVKNMKIEEITIERLEKFRDFLDELESRRDEDIIWLAPQFGSIYDDDVLIQWKDVNGISEVEKKEVCDPIDEIIENNEISPEAKENERFILQLLLIFEAGLSEEERELTFLISKVNEYVSNFDPTPFLENESFPLRWEADVLIQDYDFKENTLNLDEGDDEYLTSIGTAIEIKKYDNGSYEFWDGVHYKESHSWISELNNNKDYPSFSLLNKKFEDFESLKSFLDETYG